MTDKPPLKPVPSVEPDYTRCRAVVLMTPGWQQCSRPPVETRQDTDGALYRVCRQHKRARCFFAWTAAYLPVSREERLGRIRRGMERMAVELGVEPPPPRPKVVK